MTNREERLAYAFVQIADTLVDDYDLVETLSTIADRCSDVLEAPEVGLMLSDEGSLRLIASSSRRMADVELFEIQVAEGPCYDCFHSAAPVVNANLDEKRSQWPAFAPYALEAGFKSVHALPMRLRSEVIGVLNVFYEDGRTLTDNDIGISQSLADAATIAILQERSLREARVLAEQLQHALDSRVVIEQAKGMLAEKLQLSVDQSAQLLREYARSNNARIADVAARTLAKELDVSSFTKLRRH